MRIEELASRCLQDGKHNLFDDPQGFVMPNPRESWSDRPEEERIVYCFFTYEDLVRTRLMHGF